MFGREKEGEKEEAREKERIEREGERRREQREGKGRQERGYRTEVINGGYVQTCTPVVWCGVVGAHIWFVRNCMQECMVAMVS